MKITRQDQLSIKWMNNCDFSGLFSFVKMPRKQDFPPWPFQMVLNIRRMLQMMCQSRPMSHHAGSSSSRNTGGTQQSFCALSVCQTPFVSCRCYYFFCCGVFQQGLPKQQSNFHSSHLDLQPQPPLPRTHCCAKAVDLCFLCFFLSKAKLQM